MNTLLLETKKMEEEKYANENEGKYIENEEIYLDENEGNEENECIVCLGEYDTNVLSFPIRKSTCSCKYNIHVDCLINWKMNCPMCQAEIKNFTVNDLHGKERYTNLNKLNDVTDITNITNVNDVNDVNNIIEYQQRYVRVPRDRHRCVCVSTLCIIVVSGVVACITVGFLHIY
jgi:hypothetical protein